MDDPISLQYATPEPRVPGALKAVAWLFIIGGVLTILQVLLDLLRSKITISAGILGVFVGPGLLRFRTGWRTCALVLLWIGMLFAPIVLIFMLAASGSINADIFGLKLGTAPMPIRILASVFWFGLTVWEYRVLVREDIRQLFGLPPR
jgi:hypothetical protein